ncbi:MAG: hypothetical protein PWQ37_1653 [Candidatus Petromonas sp.]|nr:hypothetical protein [Candidatus Petromonas sp.]
MVINMKYFIITIIAIFLSLSVGIVIGVVMDSQQLFINQQKQLVAQIEEEFYDFKQKNYQLTNRLESYQREKEKNDKFLNSIYDFLINDRLKGLNILLLKIYDNHNYTDVVNTLKKSGVNKVIQVTINKEITFDSQETLEYFKDKYKIDVNDTQGIEENMLLLLFKGILGSKYTELHYYLKDQGIIDFGHDSYESIDYVIIIDNSFKDKSKIIDSPNKVLINAAKALNIPMMAIEKRDINFSSIPFYKERGISSVDNVDTKFGKIAMIMVISGKEGSYGEKKTAEQLVPNGFLVLE